MTISKSIIIFLFIIQTVCGFCQNEFKNVFEVNIDVGLSNDFTGKGSYAAWSLPSDIYITSKRFSKIRNKGISFAHFFNERNGIKLLFGQTKYGFGFEGFLESDLSDIEGSYEVTYLEWGVSYIQRLPAYGRANIIVEPGIRYHSDHSPNTRDISLRAKDAFSFSGYAGFEMPMYRNNFFANVGLQFKLPLERYNNVYNFNPKYSPYFIGIKLGVNFQF